MRRMLTLLLALAAPPAVAQDRPPLTPTRDVAVTYRFLGEAAQQQGVPQQMQVAWLAAQQLMRSDMPGMGWMVADHRSQHGFLVMEQARMIMDVPLGQALQPFLSPSGAGHVREGNATVAGLPCTIWRMQDPRGEGRACVTSDGVLLRAEGTHQGRSGGVEATEVRFAPQDPARFRRPEGFQAMQPGMTPQRPAR